MASLCFWPPENPDPTLKDYRFEKQFHFLINLFIYEL